MKSFKFIIVTIITLTIFNAFSGNMIAGGFGIAGFLGLLIIVEVLSILFMIIFTLFKKQFKWSFLFVFVGALSFSIHFSVSRTIGEYNYNKSKSKGELIISALGKYNSDKNDSIKSLQDLVPKYLCKIPTPSYIHSEYYLSGDSIIGFNGPAWVLHEKKIGQQWETHD